MPTRSPRGVNREHLHRQPQPGPETVSHRGLSGARFSRCLDVARTAQPVVWAPIRSLHEQTSRASPPSVAGVGHGLEPRWLTHRTGGTRAASSVSHTRIAATGARPVNLGRFCARSARGAASPVATSATRETSPLPPLVEVRLSAGHDEAWKRPARRAGFGGDDHRDRRWSRQYRQQDSHSNRVRRQQGTLPVKFGSKLETGAAAMVASPYFLTEVQRKGRRISLAALIFSREPGWVSS